MSELDYRGNASILSTPILFRRRPLSLPEDLRPVWRIGLIVLLLKSCCRNGKSSRARLHVLSWGVRNQQSNLDLVAAIKGKLNLSSLIIRFDPFLDRALDFAIGEGFVQIDGGKAILLSSKGKQMAEEILNSEGVFLVEKNLIQGIQYQVTEELVKKMFDWKE